MANFYFSKNGKELAAHSLQGIRFASCAGAELNADGTRKLIGGNICRTQISGFIGRVNHAKERFITAADFGGEAVTVKLWQAGEKPEYFTLIPDETPISDEEAERRFDAMIAAADREDSYQAAEAKRQRDYLEELNAAAGCIDRTKEGR